MARIQLRFVTWIYLLWCFYHSLGLTYGEGQSTDDNKPRQLRISFGQSTREVVVLAATRANCSSSILYGDGLWNMKTNISGQTILFGTEQLNSKGLQFLHRFVLQNLNPGLTYLYHVKCNEEESELRGFKVPSNGTAWSPKFLVYGDLGVDPRIVPSLKEEVMSGEYTAVLHLGDFAYDLETDGGQKGDQFLDMIEPIASYIPYLTTPGNHENTNGTFIHYRHRFSTPTTKWPIPLSQMWYSIDVGPVHLISYDSEVYSMVDKQYISLQRDWLIKDLKKANENRKHTPWIVAIAHKPMYCSTKFQHDCNVKDFNVRESLEPIFYENSVDLLLGGHQHSYERMWPAYQWSVTARNYNSPSSPVTVVSGAGGSGSELDSMTDPPGPWTAYRMDNKTGLFTSYGIFSIKNSTHLYWEQKAASDNHVIDSFWLIQNNHGNTTITDDEASVSWSASDYITHVKDVIKSNKGLAIGLTSAFSAFLLLGCVCIIMRCKRRRGVTRRWEVVDYDKSFYADVKTEEDDDFAFDDPDPSMTSNGSKPTSKLLSSTNA